MIHLYEKDTPVIDDTIRCAFMSDHFCELF